MKIIMQVKLEKLIKGWPKEIYVREDVFKIIIDDNIEIYKVSDNWLVVGREDCKGIKIIPVSEKSIEISTYI